MQTHELKTDPEVFDAVAEGRKTFEIRYDDSDAKRRLQNRVKPRCSTEATCKTRKET